MMREPEVLRYEVLPSQCAANSYCKKHETFNLMPVGVSWDAQVTQTENEPVCLLITEHERLVGNLAVSSNPLKGIAQGLRRRCDVIKRPDFTRILIASQGEAKTVILQSNRRLVQKRDLASHAQSLSRVGDQLRRQSHTSEKRCYRHAGASEARDNKAGKAPFRHRDGSQVLFRG